MKCQRIVNVNGRKGVEEKEIYAAYSICSYGVLLCNISDTDCETICVMVSSL